MRAVGIGLVLIWDRGVGAIDWGVGAIDQGDRGRLIRAIVGNRRHFTLPTAWIPLAEGIGAGDGKGLLRVCHVLKHLLGLDIIHVPIMSVVSICNTLRDCPKVVDRLAVDTPAVTCIVTVSSESANLSCTVTPTPTSQPAASSLDHP